MKALVLAVAFVVLSSSALAGASREAGGKDDAQAATVMTDARQLGAAQLATLNAAGNWAPAAPEADAGFDTLAAQLDPGTLLAALGVLALAVSRPLTRLLRRQERQRRAAALASALAHTPGR
ncbi:MAG: hypothetical protein QM788_08350 [Roseateles sp.]|uniref:hypothetical protein n=1 Tax=Roseateles sp. TaxID=1971397 RepID=UPI0039E74360